MTQDRIASQHLCALLASALCVTSTAHAQCLDQRLLAAEGTGCSELGSDVAGDGDFVIASDSNNCAGLPQIVARIFRRDADQWVQEPIQLPSGFSRLFRHDVDLQGNWAVVGSPEMDGGFVFERRMPGGQPAWVQLAHLTPPLSAGSSVSLDGNLIAIGARFRSAGFASNVGAVEIFHWDGFTWTYESTITPAGGVTGELFGSDIDLSGDRLVVGAPGLSGVLAGSVRVYRRKVTTFGVLWGLEATLIAPDPVTGDDFGSVVSFDGTFLAVGVPFKDSPQMDAGAVYVYRRDGTTWTFEDKIVPADLDFDDRFGSSVSIESTTTPFLSVKLLVGAPLQGQQNWFRGATYLFNRVELFGGEIVWGQQAKLVEGPEMNHTLFGRSVALDRASERMVVGAPGDLNQQGLNVGAVYVYSFSTTDSDGDGVPDPCDLCPGFDDAIDANGDGIPDGCQCFGDANGDNVVNFGDITTILGNWLNDYTPGTGPGDANLDGVVNFADITTVLGNWLFVCP